MDIYTQFYDSILNNDIKNFKILLNNKEIDPSEADNWAIRVASMKGYLRIVKLLLNDKRINPSDEKNQTICFAYDKGFLNIVDLLWQDQRVKDTLKNDDINTLNSKILKIYTKIFK